MNGLRVEAAENGFIVSEGGRQSGDECGRLWVFETPKALGAFMADWGQGQTKVNEGATQSAE